MTARELRCPYCHAVVPYSADWRDPLRRLGHLTCPHCWMRLWSVAKVLEHLGVKAV